MTCLLKIGFKQSFSTFCAQRVRFISYSITVFPARPQVNKNVIRKLSTQEIKSLTEEIKTIEDGWTELSEEHKKEVAMTYVFPGDAEIAFYKGLGYSDLGKDYTSFAINAFEQAIELDRDMYEKTCREKIKALLYSE